MGKLEGEMRKEIRRTKLNAAIIGTLAVGGVLAVGLIAPNVLGAVGKLINPYQKKQNVKKSLTRLIQKGYVSLEEGHAQLTSKGEKFAALLGEGRLAPKKPKHWDTKWRILIFDIPERRRNIREHIRATLMHLGFYRLQDSVWVYPYDCEDLMTLLKVDLHIGKDVLYIIADKIEYDLPLRRHFELV